MRKGGRGEAEESTSVQGRAQGISAMDINIDGGGIGKGEQGSSQWYPLTGQGTMGTN